MMATLTLATPRNMRAFRESHPDRTVATPEGAATVLGERCFAFSQLTGEEYSADAGDYWQLADDEPLLDSEGEPMFLARRRCIVVDAFTGDPLVA